MKKKVDQIYAKHKDKVLVHCDEYHAHSALAGCLTGPEESRDICVLYEYILMLEARMAHIQSLADTNKIS